MEEKQKEREFIEREAQAQCDEAQAQRTHELGSHDTKEFYSKFHQ